MALHAFDDVDDALDATRAFLLPVDRGRWLRLALVVFFVGGAGVNVPAVNVGAPGGEVPAPDGAVPDFALTDTVVATVVALAVLATLLALAFLVVGSVMEFVLVESLREGAVHVRRYWRRTWRLGLRLAGFRAAVGLAALFVVGGLLLAAFAPVLVGGTGAGVSVALAVAALPVVFVLVVAVALVYAFTTAFVVPVMLVEGVGVLAGWRRLWPALRAEWREFAVYAVVAWLLSLGLGVAVGLVAGVGALLLALPLVVVGLVVGLALGFSPAALVVFALLALLFVVGMVAVVALVRVPVQTYLRYYALFVLGDVAPALDPIPDRRAAVRAADEPGEGERGGASGG